MKKPGYFKLSFIEADIENIKERICKNDELITNLHQRQNILTRRLDELRKIQIREKEE